MCRRYGREKTNKNSLSVHQLCSESKQTRPCLGVRGEGPCLSSEAGCQRCHQHPNKSGSLKQRPWQLAALRPVWDWDAPISGFFCFRAPGQRCTFRLGCSTLIQPGLPHPFPPGPRAPGGTMAECQDTCSPHPLRAHLPHPAPPRPTPRLPSFAQPIRVSLPHYWLPHTVAGCCAHCGACENILRDPGSSHTLPLPPSQDWGDFWVTVSRQRSLSGCAQPASTRHTDALGWGPQSPNDWSPGATSLPESQFPGVEGG